ncbi:MAG: multicopper oxidase domain-containing protein [Gemmatimonadetes bacterium]|nr:multicopper oxidase domain-containing protein [Gemmatimonadota bacterium]
MRSGDRRNSASRLLVVLVAGGCAAADAADPLPATRTWYIAAEETTWDYVPDDTNLMTGQPLNEIAAMIATPGADRIGSTYKKALYYEYTDSTFTTAKPRDADWEHLGYLGPLIRGVVGDTLRVVFRNEASRPYSIHPHGVFYDKQSEGALYADGTENADRADDGVPPGGTHVYTWTIPERAGPAPGEGSSVMWMYHSHVDEPKDVNAGLIGAMIVTRRDAARPDGTPEDVDREFVIAFAEIDENLSWYFEENIQARVGNPATYPRQVTFADLPYLLNLRETINGYSFGHLPGVRMRVGERVRWYVFGTSNFEIHAPHWHGLTATVEHMRTDVLSLVTMKMVTADMVPDNPGTWLFHCHVGPHLDFGMSSLFVVEPRTDP